MESDETLPAADKQPAIGPGIGSGIGPGVGPDPRQRADTGLRKSVKGRLFGDGDGGPTRVGRHLLLRKLGEGGMGVVYAAYDPELDRRLAIKLLRGELEEMSTRGRTRLLREAQAMAKLSHPNVAHVYEVGTHEEQVFIAMEYVRGTNLRTWLEESGGTWREVLDMYIQAGRGIAAAHNAGIVHRDFKPENVLVGEDGRPRVLDFGLARPSDAEPPVALTRDTVLPTPATAALDSPLTLTGSVMGTPAYMSPEQHRGRPSDERSDQFSFCVALYEALYGERPFAGANVAALSIAVAGGSIRDAPRQSPVPTWVRTILLRGLSVDPALRYGDIEELLEEIARDPARRGWRWAMGGGVVIGVGAAGVLGYAELQSMQAADACRTEAAFQTRTIWNPRAKDQVESALKWAGRTYAEHTWTRAEQVLDRYSEDWAAAYEEACIAQAEADDVDLELDKRMECLEARRAELAALVPSLDSGSVPFALEWISDLDPPSSCRMAAAESVDELWRRLARAQTMHDQGLVAMADGELGNANAAILEALGIRQSALGDSHPENAVSYEALGRIALLRRDYESAVTLFEQGIALLEADPAAYDETRAAVLDGLGRARVEQGDFGEALTILERARQIRMQTSSRYSAVPPSRELIATLEALSYVHRVLGNEDPADFWRMEATWMRNALAEKPAPAPAGNAANASALPPARAREYATAELTNAPEGSSVLVDGIEYCVTPCEFRVPVADGPHEIRVRKDGFQDAAVTWEPSGVDDPFPGVGPLQPTG